MKIEAQIFNLIVILILVNVPETVGNCMDREHIKSD